MAAPTESKNFSSLTALTAPLTTSDESFFFDVSEAVATNKPKRGPLSALITLLDAEYQPLDAGLTDIAALAVTDGNLIVGNGTNWVAESGTTALASLGLDTDLATFSLPASTTISAFGATLVDDANAAAVISTLGLDADIATFALPASTTISAFGATIVDDADQATAKATLGLTEAILGKTAYSAGTLTTDVKVLDLAVTWNAAGVGFTGIKFNATSTASAATSLLLDLQTDSATKFKIDKTGRIYVLPGDSSTFSIQSLTTVISIYASGNILFPRSSGNYGFTVDHESSRLYIAQGYSIQMGTGNSAPDTKIYREAAGILGIRNDLNEHVFRVYKTYTDAANYQRLTHAWNTSTALIHNEGAGTGGDGSVAFNDAALATNTTKGFIMIPSCAGTPTGVPADIPTGQIPIVFDSTNNKIYVYDGGWLSTAALT